MTKIKTAQELIEFMGEFESYRYSPSDMHVIFGCDCGCGGNFYTEDSWNEEHDQAERVNREFEEFCEQAGLEYDLPGTLD